VGAAGAGGGWAGLPFDYLRIEGAAAGTTGLLPPRWPGGGRLEIGWDVARTGHLSALWVNHAAPGKPKHLRFLVLMHNVSSRCSGRRPRGDGRKGWGNGVGCGDATGLGMDSNETLERATATAGRA
jgi:hypothetical protein